MRISPHVIMEICRIDWMGPQTHSEEMTLWPIKKYSQSTIILDNRIL
jgi:hypothetical protein